MSSHDVFKVDRMGLTLPQDKLSVALLSICLFICCSSVSSDHMLISASGCWDDWDDVVQRSPVNHLMMTKGTDLLPVVAVQRHLLRQLAPLQTEI